MCETMSGSVWVSTSRQKDDMSPLGRNIQNIFAVPEIIMEVEVAHLITLHHT